MAQPGVTLSHTDSDIASDCHSDGCCTTTSSDLPLIVEKTNDFGLTHQDLSNEGKSKHEVACVNNTPSTEDLIAPEPTTCENSETLTGQPHKETKSVTSSTKADFPTYEGAPPPRLSGPMYDGSSYQIKAQALVKLSKAVDELKNQMKASRSSHHRMQMRRKPSKETNSHEDKPQVPCASSIPVNPQGPQIQAMANKNNIIIFDWDDTLIPTWYLQEVRNTSGCKEITPSSSLYPGMDKHAQVVKSLLRACR